LSVPGCDTVSTWSARPKDSLQALVFSCNELVELGRRQKIFVAGNSNVVSLPPDWLRQTKLEPGDAVVVRYDRKSLRIERAEED